MNPPDKNKGIVYLVGAGPGDPGLLTLRGLQCIEQAEVILYDELVGKRIVEWFPKNAKIEYVGKSSGKHSVPQEEICKRLVDYALEGKRVLRIKGGDPFLFGRGAEEAMICVEAGVAFEVVPGITSALSVPTYAGIPVTHRDASASVSLITGHRRGDREGLPIPTPDTQTLIYLMGVKNLPNIVAALIDKGRDPETPAAVIERGTTPAQRTVTGTLKTIAAEVEKAAIKPPSIIIIGEVTKYRESLKWFENRPLFGLRILITRPADQASELGQKLEAKGALPLYMPAIAIQDLVDPAALDQTIQNLSNYDYLVFTSVNGVSRFISRLEHLGKDGRWLAGLTIAAIGPRTARGLQERFINPELIPDKYVAESLLEKFPEDMNGKKVLIPRALKAREILPDELRKRGAEVDVVPVYETVAASQDAQLPQDTDVVLFTSSSTVDHFLSSHKVSADTAIASIGPVTGDTLKEHGYEPTITATEHTMDGLVDALEDWAQSRKA